MSDFTYTQHEYDERVREMRHMLEHCLAVAIAHNMNWPAHLILEMLVEAMEEFVVDNALELASATPVHLLPPQELAAPTNNHANHVDDGDWMEEGDEGLMAVFTIGPYMPMQIDANDDVIIIDVITIE